MRSGFGDGFVRVFVLAAVALLFASPVAAADGDIVGRWTGVVRQTGGQSYEAIMEFDSEGHGRSDYPSLNCAGKLSGAGRKGAYRFQETIASTGRAGAAGRCIDGTIDISVSGDVMHWSWTGAWHGKPIEAAGDLTRVAR